METKYHFSGPIVAFYFSDWSSEWVLPNHISAKRFHNFGVRISTAFQPIQNSFATGEQQTAKIRIYFPLNCPIRFGQTSTSGLNIRSALKEALHQIKMKYESLGVLKVHCINHLHYTQTVIWSIKLHQTVDLHNVNPFWRMHMHFYKNFLQFF